MSDGDVFTVYGFYDIDDYGKVRTARPFIQQYLTLIRSLAQFNARAKTDDERKAYRKMFNGVVAYTTYNFAPAVGLDKDDNQTWFAFVLDARSRLIDSEIEVFEYVMRAAGYEQKLTDIDDNTISAYPYIEAFVEGISAYNQIKLLYENTRHHPLPMRLIINGLWAALSRELSAGLYAAYKQLDLRSWKYLVEHVGNRTSDNECYDTFLEVLWAAGFNSDGEFVEQK